MQTTIETPIAKALPVTIIPINAIPLPPIKLIVPPSIEAKPLAENKPVASL